MNYKQIYIGVNREVQKYNNNLDLTSADITYWLNKSLYELIDEKYTNFELNEESKQNFKSLYSSATLTPEVSTTTLDSNAIGYTIDTSSTDIRYIVNERVTIVYNSTTKEVPLKVITLDRLNEKILDPFSEHRVHLSRMQPLKIDQENSILIITDGNYTVTNYKVKFVKNPTLFVIADSISTSAYTVIPKKLHNELVTKTARMILENKQSPRYQTIINEENKLK